MNKNLLDQGKVTTLERRLCARLRRGACHYSFQKLLTGWCSWRTELEEGSRSREETPAHKEPAGGVSRVPLIRVDGAFSCFSCY